jgi:hypothetical protein
MKVLIPCFLIAAFAVAFTGCEKKAEKAPEKPAAPEAPKN